MSKVDISVQLDGILSSYRAGAADATKKAVQKCMKEVNSEIKKHVKGTWKAYPKQFKTKKVSDTATSLYMVWYVAGNKASISHLLENGHNIVDRNGTNHGRTTAYPHIKYGQELAEKRLPELIEEEIAKIQ